MRKNIFLSISAMLLLAGSAVSAQNAPVQPAPAATQPQNPAPAAQPANAVPPQATTQAAPAPQTAATAPTQGTAPASTATPQAAQPQATAQPQAAPTPSFTQEQLDTALAPIALYPDSLLAQLLMATTYPDQVLEAAKWSKENPKMKGEEAVKAVQDKNWDPSVASLVAFPQVLEMLSGKPEWVKELGDMFLADPDAVMLTIQGLRKKAKEAGNLKSTKEQKVVEKEVPAQNGGNNTTIIEIQPANPEVVYVPAYNPTVVYGSWWYPTPPYYYHPPYYNPVAAIIGFGAAIAVGHALWSHWDWHHHDININVNRYNKINVNKRLDVHNKRASWRQNIRERNPRYNKVTRDRARDRLNNRPGNRTRPAARDLQRERARQQLQRKGGVDLDRARQNLQRNPERVNKAVDRANRMSPAQKQQLRDRVGERRSGTANRPSREVKRPSSGATDRQRPSVNRDKSSRPVQKRTTTKRPSVQKPKTRPKTRQPRSRPSISHARPSRPSGGRAGGGLRGR